jgi:hypothetical protein
MHSEPTLPQHIVEAIDDNLAVDAFARAMKEKLDAKRRAGRSGWRTCPPALLSRMLQEHAQKGDPVDVANFAMMLHQVGSRIEAAPPASVELVSTLEKARSHPDDHKDYEGYEDGWMDACNYVLQLLSSKAAS